MNTIILRIVYECHFRVLKVKYVNKSLTNMMNLTQNGAAGYLNTIKGVIMYTLSFEYHIQGIL